MVVPILVSLLVIVTSHFVLCSESDSDAEVDPWVDSHHHQNLQDVDIDSDDFKALPPELQHEMIIEMKETRKRNSWEMIQSLPAVRGLLASFSVVYDLAAPFFTECLAQS